MNQTFDDREEAGRKLAAHLERYAGRPEVLVLALPRGGVPVAREIARALHAPLDVLVVRKLGLPGDEELAMGAVTFGGLRVLNPAVIAGYRVPKKVFERVAIRETRELERRETVYRAGRPPPVVRGRTVILVDDGVATGSTMSVAVAAMRDAHAGRVIVAAPVMARESYLELREKAEEVVTLQIPKAFGAVGAFYSDFHQTSDGEVCKLLALPTV
ncbi:MAG: phosphoribosyltransferase family protein [Candidatus Didemnitutus sp.]|nr:phosphoribosyltransferase family protein [Candidatus Didemnitutus sp.]